MAADILKQLCSTLQETEFSLQLDESTLPNNESLLLAYVRFVHDGKLCQKMLFARRLETDTKGLTVYETLKDFFTTAKDPDEQHNRLCY